MSIFQRLKSHISLEAVTATLVIGFGLILRLRQYTFNISFWLDEAMLALNIVNRTFGGLVGLGAWVFALIVLYTGARALKRERLLGLGT